MKANTQSKYYRLFAIYLIITARLVRQCTYKLKMRRVRETIVAVGK